MANPGWAKGVSGNPGGRRKQDITILELCRKHSADAVKVMVSIMNDEDAPPTARLGAAQAIIDRAYGKPAQAVTGEDGGPIRIEAELSDRDVARQIALLFAKAK